MRTHFWQGQVISNEELVSKLESIESLLEPALVETFDLDLFVESCDAFSKELKSESEVQARLVATLTVQDGLTSSLAKEIITSIADFISKKQLKFKINNELGSFTPFTSQRVNSDGNVFEKWEPLGLVVQVLSGNDYALPVLSAFEGLMSGNINILKLSHNSSSFTQDFFYELTQFSQTERWKNRICVVNISSKEKAILERLYSHADGVVAWGGEEAINEIRKSVPASARFIDWGHKISFSYLTKKEWQNPESVKGVVHDIFVFNQQACSSPQCVYLEDASFQDLKTFSDYLGKHMTAVVGNYSLNDTSDMESAEITKMGLIVKTEKSLMPEFSDVIEDRKGQWRIWIDSRQSLRASPLYKTIWVKPIQRPQILKTFRPMKQYLQTVGLSCHISELFELSRLFYSSGVTRIRSSGKMQDSYMGEPHDGHFALNRYVRRVSLESKLESLSLFSTLNDLHQNKIHFAQMPAALMDKVDFQNIPDLTSSQLYFKSGGSSGASKISQFTYVDYHTQMRAAANGLMAAGLDPRKDRTMNVFFGGGLYGGFLSFFSILEELKAVQFPMSAYMDYEFVGQIIKQFKVNTLMGMPSYLMQLLEHNRHWISRERSIEKIFYGGEAFTMEQIERLKKDFGVSVIKSASYGSVDMGPLGYQCPYSDNKTYHLHHNLHYLEIIKLDSLQSTDDTEIGRLVFSTHSREDQNLLRYDVGDLGRWVTGDCPCGRKSPRFELHGRYGDIFRAAGSFLNYTHIGSLLAEKLGLMNEFQIVLQKYENKELMTILISSQTEEATFLRSLKVQGLESMSEVTKAFLGTYYDLDELVNYENVLDVRLELVPPEKLKRSSASGKLLHVIDNRGLA